MINNKIGLIKVLEEAKEINGRVKLQKIIYLLQQKSKMITKNMGFDYNYVYYNHGPFSKELAEDITEISRNTGEIIEIEPSEQGTPWIYQYSSKNTTAYAKYDVMELFGMDQIAFKSEIGNLNSQSYELLELTATIVYLYNKVSIKEEKKLKDKCNVLKPHLINLFEKAYELAQEYFIN